MSNKTLKANVKKIKLARKRHLQFIALLIGFVVFVGGVTIVLLGRNVTAPESASIINCKDLIVSDRCITLERVSSTEDRMKGLSDRDSLQPNTGILFEFEQPAEECFWMKDMRFSVDMIWINEDKKITKILSNVSPETYPESYCSPDTKYVLELNADDASHYGLAVDQQLQF